jgi:hypothetical protein
MQPVSDTWRSIKFYESRGSVFGKATGSKTEESSFHSRHRQEIFSSQSIQTGSGAHPASYSMAMRGGALFPRIKRPGREAEYSHPSRADVKAVCSCTSTVPFAFKACTGTTLPFTFTVLKLYVCQCCTFQWTDGSFSRVVRMIAVYVRKWMVADEFKESTLSWNGSGKCAEFARTCGLVDVKCFPSPCPVVVSLLFVSASCIVFVHACILCLQLAVYP